MMPIFDLDDVAVQNAVAEYAGLTMFVWRIEVDGKPMVVSAAAPNAPLATLALKIAVMRSPTASTPLGEAAASLAQGETVDRVASLLNAGEI